MAHAGYSVVLLERNGFAGGKCSSLARRGYLLDAGVHMFGRGPRGPFGEIARILGEGPRWSAAAPSYTPYLPGRGGLEMCSNLLHPLSVLNLARARLRGWQHLSLPSASLGAAAKFGLPGLISLGRDFLHGRYPGVGEWGSTVRDFLSPLGGSDDLNRAIHCQVMVTMALPWHRASQDEFFHILGSMVRAGNLCYPHGGCGSVPQSFLRALERRGGEVRLGCGAERIEVEGTGAKRARGVTTSDGEFIPAAAVISGAGLKPTLDMAGRENLPGEYLERAEGMRESEAFAAVRLLLDRRVSSMRTPCLLRLPQLPPDGMFDYLEDGGVPDDLFLFVTVPSRWDPSLAPPGRDAIVAGVPAPARPDRLEQCDLLLDRAEELLAEMFPELAGAVVERSRVTAADVSRLTGKSSGECIGLAQEPGQSGPFRPASTTPIGGLYLVGADAGGRGIGTEMAADSALRLYNLLKCGLPGT